MAGKFETVAWAKGANIYEVNVRQYTPEGTFAAFAGSLPRLAAMGVDILWLMPVTPISVLQRQGQLGSYYACSDYKAVNPEFGILSDLRQLVQAAHQLKMKVIIDWVANHTGCDHVWMHSNPDFYKKDASGNFYEEHGWIDVIDLDYSSNDLWTAMVEAMHFWLDSCDIDGFRCDMAHLVPLDFWAFARQSLDQKKQLFWLAECEEVAYHQVFDATYGWQLLHAMEDVWKGALTVPQFREVLHDNQSRFPATALRAFFTSNHDENSHSGSEYERMGKSAKALAVLCATWAQSIPLIYSGQELPNTKRLAFFDKDQINWHGENLLHDFYKTLLGLRKGDAAFSNDNAVTTIVDTSAANQVLAFCRQQNDQKVLVILNLSALNRLRFTVLSTAVYGDYKSVFSGVRLSLHQEQVFELQQWEYLVYRQPV